MLEKNSNANVGESAIKRVQKRTVLKKQRTAIILSAVAVVLLVATLLTVMYFIEIYQFPDVDGTEYDIKKINGIYELCYKSGEVVHKTDEGYYQTDAGTLVLIDPATGEYTVRAVVDTYATEQEYYKTVLLFAGMTYNSSSQLDKSKVMNTLEIHNEHGSFTFKRAKGNNFEIVGYDGITYDTEKFASLVASCGQPMASMKLENPKKLSNGSIDRAEYGLTSEKRTKIETDEDGNETEVEYDYTPAYYIIKAENGDWHKITVGDLTVTGEGRYATYDGGETFDSNGKKTVWTPRDTVYIIDNTTNALGYSGLEDVFMGRVEDIVSPMIVYPMSSNNYFNVHDFIIFDNIQYDAIYEALVDKFGDPENLEDGSIDADEFNEFYDKTFSEYSHKACHFSYQDMEERQGTLNAYMPYVSNLEYTGGYYINSTSIDTVLYALYSTEFTRVEKLSPSDAELEEFGLDSAPYIISFWYKTTDSSGEEIYVENNVQISAKNEDGIFYAYSSTYDMIVGIAESSFGFLEWEEIEWYESNYIQMDLGYVTDIKIEAPEANIHFEIDDSASRYMTYFARTGDFVEGNITYSVKMDETTGKYVLTSSGKKPTAVYNGDYFVSPIIYKQGTPEHSQYLFVETAPMDINGDGNDDYTAYYFYNLSFDQTTMSYSLSAQVSVTDAQGNKVAENKVMPAERLLVTDFFITNSGYMFMTNKNTYIGNQLTQKYGKADRGRWGSGVLYGTTDGKYVLVNSRTGEWSILDNPSCGIYFCDGENSRFAKRAIEISEKYENGKLVRYGETYYPLKEADLQYNEESGAIQIYDHTNKVWQNATYEDCTIGVWSHGTYYVTEGGNIVVVNDTTGDYGLIGINTSENYVADVIANGSLLDYHIPTTNHVGTEVISSAMDNFKQFYGGLLYASLEGMAELSEEEKEAFKALDNFSDDSATNPCQLKITVYATDFYGNRHDVVYRFYQYSERKSYITIEKIYYEDGYASNSQMAYGSFYVLRTFADKMIEDALKIINAQEVTAITKY